MLWAAERSVCEILRRNFGMLNTTIGPNQRVMLTSRHETATSGGYVVTMFGQWL